MTPSEIANDIQREIQQGVYSPGEALNQVALAAKYGVSRIPIREALSMLATAGAVEMFAGTGARVKSLNQADLQEIYELRMLLEPRLAAAIIAGSSKNDLARLNEFVQKMLETESLDDWMSLNFEFHSYLYSISGMPKWEKILLELLGSVQPYSRANVTEQSSRELANREHQDMVEAISAGAVEPLSAHITAHLEHAKARLENKI